MRQARLLTSFLEKLCITGCEGAGLNWTSDFLTLKPGNHPFTGSHFFLLVKWTELFESIKHNRDRAETHNF